MSQERVSVLEAAIRKHRDQRGDDRCWLDDEELYATLPEGFTPVVRDSCVELERCKKFIECRHNPATQYISPQRKIEELEHLLRKFMSNHGYRCFCNLCVVTRSTMGLPEL
jgi:hypothetical protein